MRFFTLGFLPFLALCCGGDFATTSMARSKRAHASGLSSLSDGSFAMDLQTRLVMLDNYRLLMEETKQRIGWLNLILAGKISLPNTALQEFGFLQLRIICELIALACLTAHGDLPAAREKRLREEWNATQILKRLEILHHDFYPRPVSSRRIARGHTHFDDVTSDFLSKKELVSLYVRSSELIHRGSIAKLLIPKSPWPRDNAELTSWGQKTVTLLREHVIGRVGGDTYLICKLANPDESNQVQVAFAEAPAEVEQSPRPPTMLPGLHPSMPWSPKTKK
jgi:hypothetical protein